MSDPTTAAPADARIFIYGLDASGAPCPEGYYATDGRTVYLMPPTGEMIAGWRYATQAEVDRAAPAQGMCPRAPAELIANCDPCPSDREGGLPCMTAGHAPLHGPLVG